MEKQFIQLQLGLFFQSDFSGQFETISLMIKEKFGNDLVAQVFELPGAPSEIPRIVANSEPLSINVAKNRIDFFSKKESFVADDINKIFAVLAKLSVKIGRIGIVKTYFKESGVNEFKKIFNETIFSENQSEVFVRFNKRINLEDILVNDSHTYALGSVIDHTKTKKDGIVITRDINTLIEDLNKNDFTQDKLSRFVAAALIKENDSII